MYGELNQPMKWKLIEQMAECLSREMLLQSNCQGPSSFLSGNVMVTSILKGALSPGQTQEKVIP